MSNSKGKHLTLENRIDIQTCLDKGMTFKETGKFIDKDPSTVSKEIKRHIVVRQTTTTRFAEDGSPLGSPPCPLLLKPPYVCNGCEKKRRKCGFDKQVYIASKAHEAYLALLSEAREGIALTRQEFYDMDETISIGVKNGQHIYHIATTHKTPYSISSIYRLLDKGYLSCSSLDLPRKVKFKARKKPRPDYVPKACRVGRTHEDFLEYIQVCEISEWVEMDTVIGRIGGKVIVTFLFTCCNFMFGLLADNKTALEVSSKIRSLKETLLLNGHSFGEVFPLILTDNGGEFSNVAAVENDASNQKESSLFFCDPMQSSQKARVEKNHTLFRDIVPKGSSFDHFTQEIVDLIFSHVNSVKRKEYKGKSAYELFTFMFSNELADILGITRIPPEQVIQSPKLLKDLGIDF